MADLARLAQQHLETARSAEHGRSVELIVHDGPLRQTVIALLAGSELSEHNAPPAASIQVLSGQVRVSAPGDLLSAGQIAVLTHGRHAVSAPVDAVFLLTTVTSVPRGDGPERAR